MTWIPTTPDTVNVPGPTVQKSLNRFSLASIEIDVSSRVATVRAVQGYDDAGQTRATGVIEASVTLAARDMDALVTALYTLLAAAGDIPPGGRQ